MALTSTEKTAILGLVVAAYGAILSTVNSFLQLLTHRKDRVNVILTARRNMVTLNQPRYAGMVITLLTATNRGKRPVTIEGFGAKKLNSKKQFWLPDVRPATPCSLTEGQTITAHVHESDDLHDIESYLVWDTAGRHFYRHIAPWHRRLGSSFRRRYFPLK